MENRAYNRYELMHGLIKLADDCEIADYWYKKAKIDGLIKEIDEKNRKLMSKSNS